MSEPTSQYSEHSRFEVPHYKDLQIDTAASGMKIKNVKTAHDNVQNFFIPNLYKSLQESGRQISQVQKGEYTPAQKEVYRAFAEGQRQLTQEIKTKVEKPLKLSELQIKKAENLQLKGIQKLDEKKTFGFRKSLEKRIMQSYTYIEKSSKITADINVKNRQIADNIKEISTRLFELRKITTDNMTALRSINEKKEEIDNAIDKWKKNAQNADSKSARKIRDNISSLRDKRKQLVALEKEIANSFKVINDKKINLSYFKNVNKSKWQPLLTGLSKIIDEKIKEGNDLKVGEKEPFYTRVPLFSRIFKGKP